jgi:hypothetical protein
MGWSESSGENSSSPTVAFLKNNKDVLNQSSRFFFSGGAGSVLRPEARFLSENETMRKLSRNK